MAIALVGTPVGIAGSNTTSPHVLTYSSAAGNTLIITGHFYNAGATDFPVSITDTAGNTWQVSTGNAQTPPTQQVTSGSNVETNFIAWCVNAAAVTTVTVARQDTGSNWWRIALSEWSGIAQFDNSWAGTSASSLTFTLGPVTLNNAGELVVGVGDTASGAGADTVPAGWSTFAAMGANDNGYYLPGTTGPYSPQWSTSAADLWAGVLAVFSPVQLGVVPPPYARPGQAWQRAFWHRQDAQPRQLPVFVYPPPPVITAPPATAQPGLTWRRFFQPGTAGHRTLLPAQPPQVFAVAGLASAAASVPPASYGDAVPGLAQPGKMVPGRPLIFAGATVLTGITAPPPPPAQALPGPAWLLRFAPELRGRRQPAPPAPPSGPVTTATAGTASATGTALGSDTGTAQVQLTVNAALASGTGAAQGAVPGLAAPAALGTGTAAAQAATVIVAPAAAAAAAGGVPAASASLAPAAGLPAATGTSEPAAAALTVTAALASATGAAQAATPSSAAAAGLPAATAASLGSDTGTLQAQLTAGAALPQAAGAALGVLAAAPPQPPPQYAQPSPLWLHTFLPGSGVAHEFVYQQAPGPGAPAVFTTVTAATASATATSLGSDTGTAQAQVAPNAAAAAGTGLALAAVPQLAVTAAAAAGTGTAQGTAAGLALTGTTAAAAAAAQAATGTGVAYVAPVPPARPGPAWREHFRNRQQLPAPGPAPPSRFPLALGGTEHDDNALGGTALVDDAGLGGTALVDDAGLGGTVTVDDAGLGGTQIGWSMQAVPITLAEWNDELLDVAITSGGNPLNLAPYGLQAVFKSAAGTPDSGGITISTTGGGIVITNAAAGLAQVTIPHADLQGMTIGFWRLDLVNGSLINTAIYGPVTVTPL